MTRVKVMLPICPTQCPTSRRLAAIDWNNLYMNVNEVARFFKRFYQLTQVEL
ncbi:MAG: hypothetical protein GY768_23460 [Planctomycetaceae bacterium]|nr:hypothetical protein [Planctomycetaceae bacterium]